MKAKISPNSNKSKHLTKPVSILQKKKKKKTADIFNFESRDGQGLLTRILNSQNEIS